MSKSDRPSDSYGRATAPSSDSSFDLQKSLDKLEEEKRKLRESEAKVEEAKRTLGRDNPKIQKVQPYLRNRQDFTQYYYPKLVSIGPIHAGDKDSREKLKGGERYKMIWAAMYLEDTKQNARLLLGKIRNELPALMELYAEEVIEGFRGNNKEEELAWMFLLDGCAVLEFIRNYKEDIAKPDAKRKVKVDQLVLVHQDLLLLENQLPYRLLTLLSNGPENDLDQWIVSFLKMHPMAPSTTSSTGSSKGSEEVKITVDGNQPPHLLHVLRQSILGYAENKSNKDGGGSGCVKREKFQTYRNIQELKAAGIAVTKWKVEKKKLTDIGFDLGIGLWARCIGRLKLSPLTVDDLTLPTFLNLISYEMCPDFENRYEISSYVAFMDSLIDHPDDVKQLRKAHILHNVLGSDEEVAHLFNAISADLMPNIESYREVRSRLENRYNTIWLTWVAQAAHDHFSTPWTFLGFVATILALVLTFVQTWYSMHPPNDSHPHPHT